MLSLGLSLTGVAVRAASGGTSAPDTLTVSNEEFYGNGDYFLYLGPWGSTGLTQGVDYESTATFVEADFPNAVTFDWRYPNQVPPSGGVFCYDYVAYGNYTNATNNRPVDAVQVSALASCFQRFDWEHSGSDNFNLLVEAYLNSTADAAPANRVIAVDWFPYASASGWTHVLGGDYIGSFIDGFGVTWGCRYRTGAATPGQYALFYPVDQQPILSGYLDWGFALDFLVTKGVIADTLYLTGIGFGYEVATGGGEGTMILNDLDVSFNNAAPEGYGTPEIVAEDTANLLNPLNFATQGAWTVEGDGDIVASGATGFELTPNPSDTIPAGTYTLSFEVIGGTGAFRFVLKDAVNANVLTAGPYTATGSYSITLGSDVVLTQLQATGAGFTGTIRSLRLEAA